MKFSLLVWAYEKKIIKKWHSDRGASPAGGSFQSSIQFDNWLSVIRELVAGILLQGRERESLTECKMWQYRVGPYKCI